MAVVKLLSFVALIALVGHAQAQVISSGSCPSNVTVEPNFNVVKYLGTWYQYARYPHFFEGDGICSTAEYTLQDDGNVGVRNTQVNATTGEVDEILGSASVVSNGKLLVVFPDVPNVGVTSNYWVLGTDYTSYSVVYSCQAVSKVLHSTFVWILTRDRIPNSGTIKCATEVLQKNNVSLAPLTPTKQLGCV